MFVSQHRARLELCAKQGKTISKRLPPTSGQTGCTIDGLVGTPDLARDAAVRTSRKVPAAGHRATADRLCLGLEYAGNAQRRARVPVGTHEYSRGVSKLTEVLEFETSALSSRSRSAVSSTWDNIVQPAAAHADEVPWHGDAVTPEWITEVVAKSTPGAKVTKLTHLGGDNGSSARRIVTVEWNSEGKAAGLPERLFTKSTPGLAMRLSAGRAAPAEGEFLLRLRPFVPIDAPRCLYSARDPHTGRSMHMMEDLTSTHGATFCRAHSVIDRSQAEQVVDTIATLHGTFLDGVTGHDTSFLRTYESFFQATVRNGLEAMHDEAMVRAEDAIPPQVTRDRDRIWSMAEASLAMHERSPRTVIHSDVHLGNWYITRDGVMGLSDWARVCRGHWGRDLAYALMTVLDIEDRRAWERALIERYCEKFAEVAKQPVEFDRAWEAYRRLACLALLMWTPTLCPPPTLPDMQPEATSIEMIKRITTAMDDLEVLSMA